MDDKNVPTQRISGAGSRFGANGSDARKRVDAFDPRRQSDLAPRCATVFGAEHAAVTGRTVDAVCGGRALGDFHKRAIDRLIVVKPLPRFTKVLGETTDAGPRCGRWSDRRSRVRHLAVPELLEARDVSEVRRERLDLFWSSDLRTGRTCPPQSPSTMSCAFSKTNVGRPLT